MLEDIIALLWLRVGRLCGGAIFAVKGSLVMGRWNGDESASYSQEKHCLENLCE